VPQGYDQAKGLDDFSVDNHSLGQFVKYLIAEKEYEPLIVEPNDFTLRKIIAGDAKSDNIPSIYVKVSKTGLRYGITDKKADKILSVIENEFDRTQWLNLIDAKDENLISRVVDVTMETVGIDKAERQEIIDNFGLNSRLIRLSMEMIPAELVNMIKYKFFELDHGKKFDYHSYLEYAYVKEP